MFILFLGLFRDRFCLCLCAHAQDGDPFPHSVFSHALSWPGSADSGTTTGALARAGPCPGFEKLKLLNSFEFYKAQIKLATSEDDLKLKVQACDPMRKLFNTLLASCRVACSDLAAAQAALRAEAEAAEKLKNAGGGERKRKKTEQGVRQSEEAGTGHAESVGVRGGGC